MQISSDFRELLSLLGQHRVRYLVVGGYAVTHHAEPRFTKDIDLFVEASPANAKRLLAALHEFAGPLPELTREMLEDPDSIVMMGRPPTRVDILKSIDGVRFETAWKNRVRAKIADVTVNLISRRDLMRNKRASGRPQDLIDLELLEKGK